MSCCAWPGLRPGPGGESFPERGDIPWAEPEGGEPAVFYLVQPAGGAGGVLVCQARIQPFGEADQLVNAVAFQEAASQKSRRLRAASLN